jgi:hypothetical protein
VADMVLEVRALIFQRVARFIFDAPPRSRPLPEAVHGALRDAQVGDPTERLAFALHRLPARDAVDAPCGMRRMERHPTDTANALGHPLVAVLTGIIGDATRWFSRGHVREQHSMLPRFATQHRAPGMRVSRRNMRRIRAHTVLGDQHLEVGVISAQLGDAALGRMAFAVIFLAAILLDHRLGQERNDCALVGGEEGRPPQRRSRGDGAVSVVCFPTRLAGKLLGGNRAGALERSEVMALDTDHLCKGCATLQVTQHPLERWSHVCGFDRVEDRAHCRSTRDPPNPLEAVHIVLGSDLIQGES